ncbi:MAG: pyridoxamine 5'-phosphate oxidase [Candidatus Kapabacteria bacterium]|nr:pyridoxamine 5'-phosphate oxidase [Candidatus Kapabacteria bacterium]
MKNEYSHIRRDYSKSELNESNVNDNPFLQFKDWFDLAIDSNFTDPNAMTLATSSFDGKPSARIVLLKEFNENGFVFFTNYLSKKGMNLNENPFACLLFFWDKLERQIRIEGEVFKISIEDSKEYFDSRPRESRVGAWASKQSHKSNGREEIETRFSNYNSKFGEDVPLPDSWGGYILKPTYFEFWQGRTSRLHDRITYNFENENWKIGRLYP